VPEYATDIVQPSVIAGKLDISALKGCAHASAPALPSKTIFPYGSLTVEPVSGSGSITAVSSTPLI